MTRALLCLAAIAGAGCVTREPLPPPATPLSATPDEAFRHAPPPTASFRPFVVPDIDVTQLDNGLTLTLVNRPGSPVSAIRVVNRRGGENGPSERAGWSWLVGRLIDEHLDGSHGEGTGNRGIPVIPTVEVIRESASVSVGVSRAHLSLALTTIAHAVQTQSFDGDRVTGARDESLAWLRGEWLARRNLDLQARRLVYGEDHRYALPLRGNIDSLEDLRARDLHAHYQETWRPEDCALIVVGDVDLESLRAMVTESWGGWTVASDPLTITEPEPAMAEESFRTLALQRLSPPGSIFLMVRAPSIRSADFVPFTLLARMLGGMSSARLNGVMSEVHDQPEGVAVRYEPESSSGELSLESSAEFARVGAVLRSITDEMRRLSREGPNAEELETARAMVRERFVARFENEVETADFLGELFLSDASSDQIVRWEEEIGAVGAEGIRRVAGEWLRSDVTPFVVTGELSTLSAGISNAGIGRAVYRR